MTSDNEKLATYWREALAGCECVPYPTLPRCVIQSVADRSTKHIFSLPRDLTRDIGAVTLFRAAWALIVSQMTDSDDVVFGTTVSERQTLVPMRVRLDAKQKIIKYLQVLHQQGKAMSTFKPKSLKQIVQISSYCQRACDFQTVLNVQLQQSFRQKNCNDLQVLSTYGLILHIQLGNNNANATASFDPKIVEPWLALTLLYRLEIVVHGLNRAGPEMQLSDVEMLSPLDVQGIWRWNSEPPPVIGRCIHDLVEEAVRSHPDAPALFAWDGELTYSELDKLSGQIACHLINLGVGVETVVPLCFEKSMWTVVAMLAVLKAGGAFILLDPSLPSQRIHNIRQQVHATTGVTSVSCESRLSGFIRRTVVIGKQRLDLKAYQFASYMPKVNPTNAAYIIFTSGSTGEPKGCVVEHYSYCSAASGHGSLLGMNRNTRALQFGSYNFAGAIMEILMTLIHGGCVCIPSEEDRVGDLAQSIGKLNANWAYLTSTVLAFLHGKSVPSLKTICVGGEPIRSSQIREWASSVHLRQTYGSAETAAVVASAQLDVSSAVTNVGKATTARCWLVDPANVNRLVPLGAPGEVLFEGPVIGRQYVGQPENSSATFINAPSWRAAFGPCDISSRFYKTRDIASYKTDVSIELLGRKDTQVKLRGQRVELGEIEQQARLSSSDLKEVVVELTVLGDHKRKGPQLIGFLVLDSGTTEMSGRVCSCDDERTKNVIQRVRDRLESVLPH